MGIKKKKTLYYINSYQDNANKQRHGQNLIDKEKGLYFMRGTEPSI